MKKLILIRHAKSSWELPVPDFERNLTKKGIDNSYKIADKTKEFVNENYFLKVSSAVRTRETAKIFIEIWNLSKEEIEFNDNLYTFDLEPFEKIVKSCPNHINNLILFGHNCAITDFVNKFGNVFVENVPTSGFVSITFQNNDWKTISQGTTDKIIFPSHL